MSPKKFRRPPTKKRRRSPPPVLLVTILTVVLIACLAGAGYMYLHRSMLVSPLPLTPGMVLPTAHQGDDAALQRLLAARSITYTAIKHTADGYIISLNPKQQVILSRNKDLSGQISSLQIILPQLTMEGREFRTLDMRYNKPVIMF